jgi:hypothetical protein
MEFLRKLLKFIEVILLEISNLVEAAFSDYFGTEIS